MIESDFLSDGKSGIFVANKRTGELNSYVMDSLGWSAHTLAGIGTHPGLGVAGIADWNLDGRADVLWHSSAEGSFALSLGSQRGLQAPTAMSFGSQAMSLLGTQDLNGDARPELVFYDPRGAPRGHIVVVGYDIQMGFIADEGIERSLNAALQDYMKDLGKGDWKVTVVNDPSGRYDNGVVLSLRNGLL